MIDIDNWLGGSKRILNIGIMPITSISYLESTSSGEGTIRKSARSYTEDTEKARGFLVRTA